MAYYTIFLLTKIFIHSIRWKQNGKLKKYRNVIVTMSLCGVWHGVGAQYLLWGLYHGVLLTLYDSFRKLNKINSIKCINIFTTFTLISFGWILFRAENLDIAYKMYFDLITFCEGANLQILENKKSIISLIIGFIIVFLLPNSSKIQSYANIEK